MHVQVCTCIDVCKSLVETLVLIDFTLNNSPKGTSSVFKSVILHALIGERKIYF